MDVLRTGLSFEFARGERERQRHLVPSPLLRRRWRPADRAEFQVFAGAQGGRDAAPHPPTAVLPAQRCHHPHRAPCAARAASSCTQDTKKPGAARLHHLKLPLCRKDVPACVEINQYDGSHSSPSHFSAMTRLSWLCRAVRNRHHHAIERTRRKILFPHRSARGPATPWQGSSSGEARSSGRSSSCRPTRA